MNHFLGVVSRGRRVSVDEFGKNYWCFYRKTPANKNDLLLIYTAGIGIDQLYAVSQTEVETRLECKLRNMQTAEISLIGRFPRPITYNELAEDDKLSYFPPVKRRFQMTTFTIEDEFWPLLTKFLIKQNPGLNKSIARHFKGKK